MALGVAQPSARGQHCMTVQKLSIIPAPQCGATVCSSYEGSSMSEWDGSPVSGKPANVQRQSPGRARFGDLFFRVVGPRLWNALPIHWYQIICCGTLSAFRKALKTHIFKA